LVFMEFGDVDDLDPRGGGLNRPRQARYEPLDTGLLPALVIAWREDAAANSSGVHASLRGRHRRGIPEVRAGMERLADAARGAREALLAGDHERFAAYVDATF